MIVRTEPIQFQEEFDDSTLHRLKPETFPTQPQRPDPNQWFAQKFPQVHKDYGSALQIKQDRDGNPNVADISEDFLAGTLSRDGSPDTPTVYLPTEGR